MKIALYAGRQAGLMVLYATLAKGHKITYIIPQDDLLKDAAEMLNIPTIPFKEVNSEETYEKIKDVDLFVCCHGRKIIKNPILKLPCINVHPCLYMFKGADPIKKMIENNITKGSVGVHRITDVVDEGEVICELFEEVEIDSIVSIYNQLYPLYAKAILEAYKTLQPNI